MRRDTIMQRAVRSRAAKLALRGNQVSLTHVYAPAKPWCDDPVFLVGRTDPRVEARTLLVEQWVPCRKCARCLRFRQMQWRQRAIVEIARSRRTWLVTLTFAPVHLAGVMQEARQLTKLQFDRAVERAAYAHVQMYLHRLRKAGRTKFRYLGVYELGGETGRSHFHLLVHEVKGSRPLTKRLIETKWRSNVHARLVDFDAKNVRGAASYVSKYTLKSAACRLRASQGYGKAH